MYFPVLGKLKDFKPFENDITRFDEILSEIHSNNYHNRFNHRVYVYFDRDLDEKEWLLFLEKLRANELIRKNYELCCPSCDNTIDIFDIYDDIPFGEELICSFCNEEFMVTSDDIFITYSFEEEFKPLRSKRTSSKLTKAEKFPSLRELQIHPEFIFESLINERRIELEKLLQRVISAKGNKNKGKSLENLAETLFEIPPYLKYHESNVRYDTGELDVLFRVRKVDLTIFFEFSDILIIECKNWNDMVGAREIRVLSDKMDDSQSIVGIMLSKKGITGNEEQKRDAKGLIKRKWDQNGKVIMDIDYNDLEEIIINKKNFYDFLERKYTNVKISM